MMIRLILGGLTSIACAATLAGTPPSVERIDVRLFGHHSGTLSAPLTPQDDLWNTIIGEGSASGPSTSTLVDVVVAGPPDGYHGDLDLEFMVKRGPGDEVLTSEVAAVGVFSSTGSYHLGFWLDDTGCDPLRVQARIKGATDWTEVAIPFACGE